MCLSQRFVLFDFCSHRVKIRFRTEIWSLWFKSIFLFSLYHCYRESSCRHGSSKRFSPDTFWPAPFWIFAGSFRRPRLDCRWLPASFAVIGSTQTRFSRRGRLAPVRAPGQTLASMPTGDFPAPIFPGCGLRCWCPVHSSWVCSPRAACPSAFLLASEPWDQDLVLLSKNCLSCAQAFRCHQPKYVLMQKFLIMWGNRSCSWATWSKTRVILIWIALTRWFFNTPVSCSMKCMWGLELIFSPFFVAIVLYVFLPASIHIYAVIQGFLTRFRGLVAFM
jgi:hypothetical protein